MKHTREIKIGILAAVCIFLLFFGLNFLKGVNIFSPTNSYHGTFVNLHNLEEQAAVYIRGHKVGQVDNIDYDFTRDSAFTIDISINRDIELPQGTQMALVSDGLLGGMAIELQLPDQSQMTNDKLQMIEKGSFLPTIYIPGLIESVQGELLAHVDAAIQSVDSLVSDLKLQVQGDHLKNTLSNVDRVSGDLTVVSADLKRVVNTQIPTIVTNADKAFANLNDITTDLQNADLAATVARVDTAVDGINTFIADVRSQEGTLGQLIYNKSLYNHIDATVVSADSLIVDLKAHPKRYVHFSLFGKKDK